MIYPASARKMKKLLWSPGRPDRSPVAGRCGYEEDGGLQIGSRSGLFSRVCVFVRLYQHCKLVDDSGDENGQQLIRKSLAERNE